VDVLPPSRLACRVHRDLDLAALFGYSQYSPRTGGLRQAGLAAELAAWVIASTLATNQLPLSPDPAPRPLAGRRTWPRWLACQGAPIGPVRQPDPVLTWPPHEVASDLFGGRHINVAEYSTTLVLWGAGVWTTGLALAAAYVRRAPDRFLADLRRPS
jgi:hypothetical protein